MAEFVFAYRMPKNYQIGDKATREAWQAWFAGMGDDLLDIGKPAKDAETVGRSGNATWLGGFLDHPRQQRQGSTRNRRPLPGSRLRRRS